MVRQIDIERAVPSRIQRYVQHYHYLIYIKAYWESIGQQAPGWVTSELLRADAAVEAEVERETGQGGLLYEGEKE